MQHQKKNKIKRINIITSAHLCNNPRVVKEANALNDLGHQVRIFTTWTDPSLLKLDFKLIDSRIEYIGIDLCNWNDVTTFFARFKRRFFIELNRRFFIESQHSLGYRLFRLYRNVKKAPADIYICHLEVGLFIGAKLLKDGHNVAFDFEDWYSKDLSDKAQKARPIRLLERMEKNALNNGYYTTTTSVSLANALSKYYNCPKISVILNAFPIVKKTINMENVATKLSLYWFSQTIGPGRGLEFFLSALDFVKEIPLVINLRGNITVDFKKELISLVTKNKLHEICFLPVVSPKLLEQENMKYDIGLALESSLPPSRNLTITNKIMQYLAAGLAVIATDTDGQKELESQASGAIKIIRNSHPYDFAKAILFYSNRVNLIQAKEKSREIFINKFCWDLEKEKISLLVD